MGHVDINAVSYSLPDGRPLLDEITFRVGGGATAALVGPNGTGKTTLLRIVAGDIDDHEGTVTSSGGIGVMRQFIGHGKRKAKHGERGYDDVAGLLLSLAPPRIRAAAAALEASELAMMTAEDEPTQLCRDPRVDRERARRTVVHIPSVQCNCSSRKAHTWLSPSSG